MSSIINDMKTVNDWIKANPKANTEDVILRLVALEKQNKILEIKNSGTLANNLCPDHRDKQTGKPCFACRIEELQTQIDILMLKYCPEEMTGEQRARWEEETEGFE